MAIIDIKVNYTKMNKVLREIEEISDLATNRGNAGKAIMYKVTEDTCEYIAGKVAKQIGVTYAYAMDCMQISNSGTKYNIRVTDDPMSQVEYVTSYWQGGAFKIKQGKTRITYKNARIVTFGAEEGLIAYYGKGARQKQRNPRKFGTKGNAYIKYAVTVDKAVKAITEPDAPERVGEYITNAYKDEMITRFGL